ncbi:MAG TPA: hypothetical protein VIL36_07900 [Acidimicrobiales bacterium]
MGPLVTVADLLRRPGFAAADSGHLAALIDDASALVRDAVRPHLDDVEAPNTPPAVVAVIVAMVRRGLHNPLGHAQETLGDYSFSVGTGGVATLAPTRRELRIVRRAVGALGVGSVAMTGDLPLQRSELVALEQPGDA